MNLIENPGSYSISNFISFMDEVYFRLFVRQFEAWWPAHLIMLALGLAILALACMGKTRAVAIGLAIPFAFCAITFHFQLYAELSPIGKIFGWAFLIQILFILVWGFATKSKETLRPTIHAVTGTAIAIFGLLGYPALSLIGQRDWKGAEYFGMAPDPTICFFLGIALIRARPVWFILLLPVPLLWAFVTWGTLDTFEAPFALALPIIVAVTIVAAICKLVSLRRDHGIPQVDSNSD